MGKNIPYNEYIICGCGCKGKLKRFNYSGRERRYIHGHHARKTFPKVIFCVCGCGETIETRKDGFRSKYKRGHNLNDRKKIICDCGCGMTLYNKTLRGDARYYILGHNRLRARQRENMIHRRCLDCNKN